MININHRVIQLLELLPSVHRLLTLCMKNRRSNLESGNLSSSFTRHHRTRHFTCADPRRSHSPCGEGTPHYITLMMFRPAVVQYRCANLNRRRLKTVNDHEENTYTADDNIVYTMLITDRSDRVSAGVYHISFTRRRAN
jgi:hypothetical protein